MNKNFLKLFVFTLTILPLAQIALFAQFDRFTDLAIVTGLINLVLVVISGVATFNPTEINITETTTLPKILKTMMVIISISFLVALLPFRGVISLYNTHVQVNNSYKQKKQERLGFYDKLWKTYVQKENLAQINKETFIEVAKLLMENRKDGANLSWKWVQENQPVPFEEFTAFYKDLSIFIENERNGYLNLEKECLQLAQQNNTLLDTFPNNFYNKFLGLEHIEHTYGFLSDSTNQVFTSGVENVK